MEMESISRMKLFVLMGGMIIVGCLGTIVGKIQDETKSDGFTFTHPFFQTCCMFVAEFSCLGIHSYLRSRHKITPEDNLQSMGECESSGKQRKFNKLVFAIPACCDIFTSTLLFLGLLLVSASVYTMMSGGIVVFTGLFSVIFLKRTLYRHHWTGIFLIVLGLVLVSLATLTISQHHHQVKTQSSLVGIIILILAFLICSTQYIIEEKLFSKYYVHPLEVVGLEGISGLTVYLFILLILNSICSEGLKTVSVNGRRLFPGGYIEDSTFALKQIFTNWILTFCAFGGMLTIAAYNSFGQAITKFSSATSRAVVDATRTIIIWLVFLILQWEIFLWLQLIGFLILTFGTLLYNEIIIIKLFNFHLGTVKYIEQRKEFEDKNRLQKEIEQPIINSTSEDSELLLI